MTVTTTAGRRGIGVEIIDLHKAYDGVPVLRGVELQVQPGETMAIVGGSGEGKTVLLRHVIGLEQPDHGRIVVGDLDLSAYLERDPGAKPFRISMVFQNSALLNSLTVADNVGLRLREFRTHQPSAVREIVETALEQVELSGAGSKLPGELSGGMRKRAAIARALAIDPDLILYDEPTADLDPLLTQQIGELMRRIQERRGATQILVTHNLALAQEVADHIALLHRGRIVDHQTPESLVRSTNELTRRFVQAAALRL